MSVTPDKPSVNQTVTITDSPTVNLRSFINIKAPSYKYYRALTIDHLKCGSSNSTNFPAYIDSTIDATGLQLDLKTIANGGLLTSGKDYAFYSDIDGQTALDYEEETYVATTGALKAWVRIPTVSSSTDTVIYIFYGAPSVTTSQENVNGVWNTNYKAVYHLKDGTTLSLSDSTSGADTLTNNNTVTPTTGQLDGGAAFASASSQSLTHVDAAGLRVTTAFTVSAWVNATSFAAYRMIVVKAKDTAGSANDRDYDLDIEQTTGKLRLFFTQGTSVFVGFTANTALTTGSWFYCVGTYDGSVMTIYRNGVSDGTNPASGSVDVTTGDFAIGKTGSSNSNYFDGSIDEVRLSNVARSADWITTEYNNQNAPSTFWKTVGSQVQTDAVTVTEAITLVLTNDSLKTFSVSDTITVTDTPTVLIPILVPAVSDAITVSDAPTATVLSFISVSDTITVTDVPIATVLSFVLASDSITVSDSPTLNLLSFVSVSDAVTVSEVVIANLLSFISVADQITISDVASPQLLSFIQVADTITLSESITVSITSGGDLIITVSDGITVSEVVTMLGPSVGGIIDGNATIGLTSRMSYAQGPTVGYGM